MVYTCGIGPSSLTTVFILEDALSVWTNLGKHSHFVWLFVSSIEPGTRRIIRQDQLSSVGRRTTEDSSSRRIMHLVPVFILETNNQANNDCLPKFIQMDNASSSVKTANLSNCGIRMSDAKGFSWRVCSFLIQAFRCDAIVLQLVV